MQEQLITYETARLANLKGFDPNVKLKKNSHYSDLTGCLDPLDACGAVVMHHYYAAPQSVLQRWLREQRTPIIVTPSTDFVAWEVEIQHPDKNLIKLTKNNQDRWFVSYEEALEAGLQEALKLIPVS